MASAALLLTLAAARVSADGYLALIGTTDASYMKAIRTGPAQRCYTIPCFDNKAWKANWKEIQDDVWAVFYEQDSCTGNYSRARSSKGTTAQTNESTGTFNTSSVMIWGSGKYPTRGIVEYC